EGEEGEGGDVVRGVTFSVLTAIIWAIGIVLIDYALEGIDFYIANMIRFPVLAVVVGGVLLATGNHRNMLEMTRRQAVMLVLAGILALAIGGLTFFASITFVGAAEATALSSLSPIFSAVISVSSGKEAFSWRVTAGVILATSGTVILVLFG
nr:DMT family transporter [Candidatus Freyrarchaeum guaymaensis]